MKRKGASHFFFIEDEEKGCFALLLYRRERVERKDAFIIGGCERKHFARRRKGFYTNNSTLATLIKGLFQNKIETTKLLYETCCTFLIRSRSIKKEPITRVERSSNLAKLLEKKRRVRKHFARRRKGFPISSSAALLCFASSHFKLGIFMLSPL